jgi:O-antigen/teichoic acid export membrane protein
MFQSIKRLTAHSAVYGLSTILGRTVSFLLLPLFTHVLTKAEYGVVTLVLAYLGILTLITTYDIDSAFLHYYILAENDTNKRQIYNTGFWSVLLMSGALLLVGLLFATPLAETLLDSVAYQRVMKLAAGVLFFDALAILPFLLLRAEERSVQFGALKVANIIVNIAATYVLVVTLRRGLNGVFEANLISSVFTFFSALPITARHFGLTARRDIYLELLKFGLPYLPSTLAVYLLDVIDRFILQQLTDIGTVGLYGAGCKLGAFMSLLIAAFRFAWHPFFLSTSKDPNAKAIFARIFTLFMLICAAGFVGVSLFIDELVQLRFESFTLFGKEYWDSTSVVPAILLAYVFFGAYVNFIIGIHLEKKTYYLPFVTGLGVALKIVATYALVPILGMNGAALGTALGYGVMMVALYFISQRLYPIAYEWKRVIKLVFITALIFVAGYWVFTAPWQKAGLLLAFPIILLLSGFFEKGELKRMSSMFRKVRIRQQRRAAAGRVEKQLQDDL